ncbi:LOW QUALITY PROTEIN: hypothetical protein NC653_037156 [Populus alba x Populus x berolinensis]|uniref:Uncharacterized protein n=1 Tax=Populus alba x Populus x berolinensis TaxID=444605 RepID=A0AAD6PVR3_9ROSI|nr:LOW QUALITY PROTEIN: hypothetical protein NC653_037156 [Populus alba x Populus x berolinensis]
MKFLKKNTLLRWNFNGFLVDSVDVLGVVQESRFMLMCLKYGYEFNLVVGSSLAHMYMKSAWEKERKVIKSYADAQCGCLDIHFISQGQEQIHAVAIKAGANSAVAGA